MTIAKAIVGGGWWVVGGMEVGGEKGAGCEESKDRKGVTG